MTKRNLAIVSAALLVALFFVFRAGEPRVPQEQANRASPAAPAARFPAAHPAQTTLVPARTVAPAKPQPPALPFSFLGKITDGGETTWLLHGAGRVYKVHGAGPIDDRYEIESVHDTHLVIRYVPMGAQQVLALNSRQPLVPPVNPDESPQD